MTQRRYPIPAPAEDPRFSFGLIVEIAEVLQRHGYPAIGPNNPGDHVELGLALFRFLYSHEDQEDPPAAAGGA